MITEGTMPYLGYRTYYRIAGSIGSGKTPVLLLHGGPGSTHNYFEVLDSLAEEDGRALVTYDQLGCGNSYLDGHPELWTMETWLGELIALREYLGLGDVILLGQSWGGMLLLEYLCRHDHSGVRGAVLSSTLPSSRMWAEEQARMITQLPAAMQEAIRLAVESGDFTSPAYREAEDTYMRLHAGGEYGPGDPDCLTRPKRAGEECYLTAWGPNEFTPTGTLCDFDVTECLGTIDVPTLVVSGGSDLCTPYIAKYMADRIPGARWELFRTCRHTCFVEENKKYIDLLRAWMAERGI
ncbi:MAG: proline iminopeptidase-family hydrolase [Clostridia bacterium]|nr:proline iminopeptidase-family hydrolase [Clostridia bacterium]